MRKKQLKVVEADALKNLRKMETKLYKDKAKFILKM